MLRIVIGPHPGPGADGPDDMPPSPSHGASAPSAKGAASKVSQQYAGYQGPENGPFECEHCTFFSAPSACQIVEGNIDPEGCCNNFTKGGKPAPPDSDDDADDEASEQPLPMTNEDDEEQK